MRWTNFEHSCVGTSAGFVKDGEAACAAMWNPEGDMGDIESWEILEPLVYIARRIRPNTAGPGRRRGGAGWETIRFVWKTNDQVLYNLGEGHVFHGAGLFGGYPSCTGYRLNVEDNDLKERIARGAPIPHSDADPEDSELLRLLNGRVVKDNRCVHLPTPAREYDVYVSLLRGGHGLGDVLERQAEDVEADVAEGHLLPRYAERIYGVVPGDEAGTEAAREALRRRRAERAVPVSEWLDRTRERVLAKDLIYPVRDMYRESMALSPRWAGEFRSFWQLPDDFSF